jgi:crotonobetainyl-CoA:carnitine CoA-transferase CaiB-like acyl-CoA transferase
VLVRSLTLTYCGPMNDISSSAFPLPGEASRAPQPLAGIRVVDLSQNLAGPFATQILADLGADVIKVEPPAGDAARAWGPPFQGGESPLFLCANRNKRSVVLDLGTDPGREAMRGLAARCDVFVQAFRAGVIERLGFGYDVVREMNPSVVYLSVTAFGTDGPLNDQPGYDPLMQAFAGLMSVTGPAGGRPARVGTSVVDMGTGMWSAMAVLAALQRRGSDGRGAHVTSSLLDTTLSWMAYHLQGYFGSGEVPGPMGTGLGMIAPYQAFPASDGEVMIAAGNDASFRRLCDALGLGPLATDPRFASNPARVDHRSDLERILAERTRRRDVATLIAVLRDAAVPCAPIQDVGQVATDAQVAASGMLRPIPGAPIPGYVDVAMPVRWDGERSPVVRPPPRLGEHTAEVLEELGRPTP